MGSDQWPAHWIKNAIFHVAVRKGIQLSDWYLLYMYYKKGNSFIGWTGDWFDPHNAC